MPEPARSNSSNALLVQIITDIAEIKATIKGYADLETRVRELEKARWQSAWITAFASASLTALAVILVNQAIL
jgi:type IV secretory pathway component VirB8